MTSDPGPPMMDPQHRRAYRATPDRTEQCRVCCTGCNGRPLRMLPRAERKNAAHAVLSRMEERRACRAGQNGGPWWQHRRAYRATPNITEHLCRAGQNGTPPRTPGRARQNGTPPRIPGRARQNGRPLRMPHQVERKTSAYADLGGKEERRACRAEQN